MTLVIEGKIKIVRDFMIYYLYIFECQYIIWKWLSTKLELFTLKNGINATQHNIAISCISKIKISVYRFFQKIILLGR